MAKRRIGPKVRVVKNKQASYFDESFSSVEANARQAALEIKNTHSLVEALRKNSNIDIDAKVLCVENGTGKVGITKFDGKKSFLEAYDRNQKKDFTFRESIDSFAMDLDIPSGGIGKDYTPLLGGPFSKQLYLQDFLKMQAVCFHAYNHDPLAHASVNITRDFVIGRGWRSDVNGKDANSAKVLWDAFVEVNDLHTLSNQFCKQLGICGEQMLYWLPGGQTKFSWQNSPDMEPPRGMIPRVRLLDVSTCWEIITFPEDITRVLGYQLVFPTQYNLYAGKTADGKSVPGTKFIFQQLPAESVDHYKINCFDNEKRGRSDFLAALPYIKMLRDSVMYSIIGIQKATAWSIDTTVDGAQTDIDAYVAAQEQIGTVAPPGSEFVHSKKIERKYHGNEGGGKGGSSVVAFDWAFSMAAAAFGVPTNYFGTHLSGGQTRASAIVATEPVTKRFENRRQVVELMLTNMARKLFKSFGLDAEIEFTFPEMITQDRSAKMKDLALAVQQGWLSNERAAEIAAKELDITKYDWKTERVTIEQEDKDKELPFGMATPLTAPGEAPEQPPSSMPKSAPKQIGSGLRTDPNASLTSDDKRAVRSNDGY